jgi:hypothetical protein
MNWYGVECCLEQVAYSQYHPQEHHCSCNTLGFHTLVAVEVVAAADGVVVGASNAVLDTLEDAAAMDMKFDEGDK